MAVPETNLSLCLDTLHAREAELAICKNYGEAEKKIAVDALEQRDAALHVAVDKRAIPWKIVAGVAGAAGVAVCVARPNFCPYSLSAAAGAGAAALALSF